MVIIDIIIIIIIIEGLSLLQSIPPTTANKQTNSSTKERGSMARKLRGAEAESYSLKLKLKLKLQRLKLSRSKSTDRFT